MRKAISSLWMVSCSGVKDTNQIREILGLLPENLIQSLCELLATKKFDDIINFANAELVDNGFSALTVLREIARQVIVANPNVRGEEFTDAMIKLSVTESRILNGADEYIQFLEAMRIITSCNEIKL
jgi:hypothetical protein